PKKPPKPLLSTPTPMPPPPSISGTPGDFLHPPNCTELHPELHPQTPSFHHHSITIIHSSSIIIQSPSFIHHPSSFNHHHTLIIIIQSPLHHYPSQSYTKHHHFIHFHGWVLRLVSQVGVSGWCLRLVSQVGVSGWCLRLVSLLGVSVINDGHTQRHTTSLTPKKISHRASTTIVIIDHHTITQRCTLRSTTITGMSKDATLRCTQPHPYI